jgi:hypothetical protein
VLALYRGECIYVYIYILYCVSQEYYRVFTMNLCRKICVVAISSYYMCETSKKKGWTDFISKGNDSCSVGRVGRAYKQTQYFLQM